MCSFERLYACAVPYICCGILYCRRVVLIIAMLCLVSCELFLKALFTCVFQVELIKVSTQRGPCLVLPATDFMHVMLKSRSNIGVEL